MARTSKSVANRGEATIKATLPNYVVVFLQNAWSALYAGDRWPRDSWLKALQRSRSGQRLEVLEASYEIAAGDSKDSEFWYDNTTPIVGGSPDSVVPADHRHIREVIKSIGPRAVVACGRLAHAAVRPLWTGPLLLVPHPAHRVLTNALYRQAGEILAGKFDGVIELKQEKGRVDMVAA